MITVKVIITHDGTGDWKRPDHVESSFVKDFENMEAAFDWAHAQNAHPWLTTHIEPIGDKDSGNI